MRMTAGSRFALVAVSIFGLGCAADTGREWTTVGAADTPLIFTAPGLEATAKRFMRSDAMDYSDSLEVGIWSSPVTVVPKAQMMLQKLGPGYVYTSDIDIEQYINSMQFMQNKNPSIGIKQSISTRIGDIKYRSFHFDDLECMAFGINFGDSRIDDLARDLIGSDILSGYYCANPGEKLSPDTMGLVGKSIGLKGVGSP